MAGNLYKEIKEYCINQLVDAINGTGLYKAKAENGDKTAVKDTFCNSPRMSDALRNKRTKMVKLQD